jgi:hypothetical protein
MNNKQKLLHDSLEALARQAIPDDARLLNKSTLQHNTANWRMPRRSLILALICLLILVTAAVAAYELFGDPGVRGVKNAGLGSNLNLTALPTLNPATPTSEFTSVPATMIQQSQELQGVTLNLEWISLSRTRLVLGFSASNLASGMSLDIPTVGFTNMTAQQYRGANMTLSAGPVVLGEYTSFQVIDVNELTDLAALSVDIPLIKTNGDQPTVLDTFHFDLTDIPTNSNGPGSYPQSYSAKVSGQEVRLEWMKFTPSGTTAKLCYDITDSEQDWLPMEVTFQASDDSGLIQTPVSASSILPVNKDSTQRCVLANTSLTLTSSTQAMNLTIASLGSQSSVNAGPWQFMAQPSDRGPFNEEPLPTPTLRPTLESQTANHLTASLLWAYADSQRVALEMHFDGWRQTDGLGGFTVKDDNGNEITTSYGSQPEEDDPSTQITLLSFNNPAILSASPVNLHIDFSVVDPKQADPIVANFHFDLSLPVYSAKTYSVSEDTTSNGLKMQLREVSMTPSYTELTLCYQKPADSSRNSDWMIGQGATLQVGDLASGLDSYQLLSDADYGGYTGKGTAPANLPTLEDGRCVKVGFPVGDLVSENSQLLTLTIPVLQKSLPEVFSDSEIQAAEVKLKAEGIIMRYYSMSGSSGGGSGFTYDSLPQGMTQEEAYQKYIEALGYNYSGPWVLSMTIPPAQ